MSIEQAAGGPAQLVRAAARRAPDRPALVAGDQRWTWAELDAAVDGAAHALAEAGVTPGARVALQLRTGPAFVLLYLGALRAGAVAVPVNPAYTRPEVEHILADSGAVLHLDETAAAALLATSGGSGPHEISSGEAVGEQLAALLYTSGTSGPGKGAMLTVRALRTNLDQLAAVEPALITADDVVFLPLPLTHVFGLNAGLGMALRVGCTLVLTDRFDTGESLALMAAERVSVVLGVPGQYAAWLAHPDVGRGFAGVRFAMSGSTTLPSALVAGFAGLGVVLHDGYGLTEASPVVALNAIGAEREQPITGSVGRPLPGVQVELRDPLGGVVDDGDPGRIFVRGANLFSGYWPDGRGGPDADGWFGTGDIALRGAAGELHLVGRSAETVIVNGFSVYPTEVESVLAALDGVGQVAVVGTADERTGETVQAYVVPTPGAAVRPDELLAAAARSLARFKLPTRIEVVESLPRTVTGKIMKWQLDGGREHGSG